MTDVSLMSRLLPDETVDAAQSLGAVFWPSLALAEADLEEVRFARSEDQQRTQALVVVERLRHGLQQEPSGHQE